MARILVIRFSALGDVAMTVPVLYSFAQAFPQHQIVVLSRPNMAALFVNAPSNLLFRGVDVKKEYAGVKGLFRLFLLLRREHFDFVADLHGVLRSRFLSLCFQASGVKVACIDKERSKRKKLVSQKHKILVPQTTSFTRYIRVFQKLGFSFPISFHSLYGTRKGNIDSLRQEVGYKGENDRWIGLAPFAAHKGKIYPIVLQEQVVQEFSKKENVTLFLFGGGKEEVALLSKWEQTYPHVISVAGKFKMSQELALMSHLDVMIAMDSGNMHLASLTGVPVVSIWGATHPYAGFMGWGQSETNVIQVSLPCRPCSIFGNKPCLRGDYACLNQITPRQIIQKVESFL
ncbi:glycosyltransferase family 9 protein [Bacteroides mediterraneensis]|uniref:glycosyltransferase family 9 protein n=1 Tax=Bacteroides mediterraneensis TaxID=1841856 RepID=UPI0026EE339E|nr:glycosyltransferase family 9 protein [Bacteroides mediterraneensis]